MKLTETGKIRIYKLIFMKYINGKVSVYAKQLFQHHTEIKFWFGIRNQYQHLDFNWIVKLYKNQLFIYNFYFNTGAVIAVISMPDDTSSHDVSKKVNCMFN